MRRLALCLLVAACGGGDGMTTPGIDAPPIPVVDARPPAFDGPPSPACPTSCGLAGTDDCCATGAVTGGTFNRANMGAAAATVSDFQLDKYEVTVGRMRAFVNAGKGTQALPPAAGSGANPHIADSGWSSAFDASLPATTVLLKSQLKSGATYSTWTDNPGANEARPVNSVSWYVAFAYCASMGGRLPTEAEWNYAAAGGGEQRIYPFTGAIDETKASYWVDNTKQCFGDGVNGCSPADIISVGSKPAGAGKYGQLDLAGNLSEWTLDYFATAYATPCADCANLVDGAMGRVTRGGSYTNDMAGVATTVRSHATMQSVTIGFRCAH